MLGTGTTIDRTDSFLIPGKETESHMVRSLGAGCRLWEQLEELGL